MEYADCKPSIVHQILHPARAPPIYSAYLRTWDSGAYSDIGIGGTVLPPAFFKEVRTFGLFRSYSAIVT
jgi:hypothetical protein